MVREYDYLNQYSCPAGACLRNRPTPPGFVGPASAFVECYNATTGAVVTPNVWNPVYDRNLPRPAGTDQVCAAGAAVAGGIVTQSYKQTCGWLWWVIGALAALLLIGALIYLFSKTSKHKKATDCTDITSIKENQQGLLADARKHQADALAHEREACAAANAAAAHQQQATLAAQQAALDQLAAQQAAQFEQLALQHSIVAQQAAAAAANTTSPTIPNMTSSQTIAAGGCGATSVSPAVLAAAAVPVEGKTHHVYQKTQRGGFTCPTNWQAIKEGYVY